MSQPLKLMARTAEDLTVLSSIMQDATVRVGDMAYEKGAARFTLIANRFCWEKRALFGLKRQRVRAALHFNAVRAVKSRNIPEDEDHVLNLLAVRGHGLEPGADSGETDLELLLSFSGDRDVALTVEAPDVILTDLGPPWRARRQPRHGAA
ncbi:DUF2948 family protein [Yunchengibacter salinarum]|uniref:DUF2948 family protein n=1 Tax=Yunchengibacter salinarum TaxID=3133399 RepID=UPI0035B688D1